MAGNKAGIWFAANLFDIWRWFEFCLVCLIWPKILRYCRSLGFKCKTKKKTKHLTRFKSTKNTDWNSTKKVFVKTRSMFLIQQFSLHCLRKGLSHSDTGIVVVGVICYQTHFRGEKTEKDMRALYKWEERGGVKINIICWEWGARLKQRDRKTLWGNEIRLRRREPVRLKDDATCAPSNRVSL